jgi:hypothetical protein
MNKVGMPHSLFPSLLSLQQFLFRLFIPDFPPFHFVYRARLFQKILYDVTEKCIRDDWITTRLFELCFDLYTSVNKRITLAAHVRFFSPEWALREILFSTIQLEKSREDAPTIVEELLRMCADHGIDIEWLVSITSDGAPVNTGLDEGVLALICKRVAHARPAVDYAHKFVSLSLSYTPIQTHTHTHTLTHSLTQYHTWPYAQHTHSPPHRHAHTTTYIYTCLCV